MSPPIVVYFHGTFINFQNGAHARLSELLEFLGEHFDDVTLYSYCNHVDCPWTDHSIEKFKLAFPRVNLCLEQYTRPLVWFTRAKNLMLSLFPQYASTILNYRLPPASPEYNRIQRRIPNAAWIINYVDGMTQLNGLPHARKIIVETHDLKFILASKIAKSSPASVRILMKLRNEIASLNTASAFISISPPERAVFKLLTRNNNNFYIPLYLRTTTAERYTDDNEFKYDLLFVASDSSFNVEGLDNFIECNSNWLSSYKISLAGQICKNKQIVRLSNTYKNLCLLGYVDDIASIYKIAKAVISPTEGTGLKIKVVDALCHGKPVFGSDHTRDGLPGDYGSCVFPIDRAKIEAVLNNSENRRKAETAAFRYVRTFDEVSDINALLDYLKSNGDERSANS